jgi:hypothetical protein
MAKGGGVKFGRVSPVASCDRVVIVGSGKSLSGFDFKKIKKDKYYIITVNDSVQHVPFAQAWFTLDPWGLDGPQLPNLKAFNGVMYAAVPDDYGRRDAKHPQHQVRPNSKVIFLHRIIGHNFIDQSSETASVHGLSEDPRCVSTGNSGYGAFNVAYHLRPKKILLLGIDATIGYFYTNQKTNRSLSSLPSLFNSTKHQIEKAGIQVINGSKDSRVGTYPRFSIDEALERFDAD